MRATIACVLILMACHQPVRRGTTPSTDISETRIPPPPCPVTPAVLAPAADAEAIAAVDATGVVFYVCRANAWTLVDQDATMSNIGRTTLDVHHFGAGMLWADASSLVLAQAASAVVGAGNAPWLLLNVTAHGGPSFGVLAPVTQVQRLSTASGAAPTTACAAGNAGQTAEVPFTARYYLYQRSEVAAPHQRCGG